MVHNIIGLEELIIIYLWEGFIPMNLSIYGDETIVKILTVLYAQANIVPKHAV